MRTLLGVVLALFAVIAFAQPTKAPKVCDVTYVMEAETQDGADYVNSKLQMYAMPVADVDDNSKRGRHIIDVASKVQDKGGVYQVEFAEWRTCDGKTVKNDATSIMVKGVTLDGVNRISRASIKVAGEVTQRYEKRAERGDREAWDHKKARAVKRNDLAVKQW